jgi:hypothetical protein
MHGEMQKRIGFTFFDVEFTRHRLGLPKHFVVFGVLLDPTQGDVFQRRQDLLGIVFDPSVDKKLANLIS